MCQRDCSSPSSLPGLSLVQRMGRCNRRAEMSDAEVLWVNIEPKDEKDDLSRPYAKGELDKARPALAPLDDASPQTLREVSVEEERIIRPVIRRRDLIDLFDTTPDICGQDLDISRYIRDGDDNDVQFFWRDIAANATPPPDEKPPQRLELCRVAIGDAAKFLDKKTTRGWRWKPLDKKWETAAKPRPGAVYLVAVSSGGYDDRLGWTGEPKDKPKPHPPSAGNLEGYDDEPETFCRSMANDRFSTPDSLSVKPPRSPCARRATLPFRLPFTPPRFGMMLGRHTAAFQKMLRAGAPLALANLGQSPRI